MTREQAEARADRVLEVWAKETNGTVYKGGIDWNKGARLIADALIEAAQPETVRCHQCGCTAIFKQEGKEILFYHSCWSTRQSNGGGYHLINAQPSPGGKAQFTAPPEGVKP